MPSPGVAFNRSAPLRLEPDVRAADWGSWASWADKQARPLAVDLFAGGGGLSLGLEDAGFRVAFAADHDKWSVETHAANFQGLSAQLDLSDPTSEAKIIDLLGGQDIALVAGGPPCQPFSRAGRSVIRHLVSLGRRPAYDDRRDLWQVWLRIVLAVRPRAVLLENVPDMALGDDLGVVRRIVEALQEADYETHLDIVEAPEYGIPQHRQRLILVALRNQATPFTWPTPSERVSIWDAIGDLPALGQGVGADVLPYRKRSRTPFQEQARRELAPEQLRSVYDHVTRAVRDDDREAFRLMGPNTRYSDLPAHLKRYRDDTFDDKYKRHGRDELSRSITAHIAKDGYWYIHPTEERTLSVREAARLQTFPDRYRFAGTRTHAFKQIGNAVPPPACRTDRAPDPRRARPRCARDPTAAPGGGQDATGALPGRDRPRGPHHAGQLGQTRLPGSPVASRHRGLAGSRVQRSYRWTARRRWNSRPCSLAGPNARGLNTGLAGPQRPSRRKQEGAGASPACR